MQYYQFEIEAPATESRHPVRLGEMAAALDDKADVTDVEVIFVKLSEKAERFHSGAHAQGGEDPITPASIGAMVPPPATGDAYVVTSSGYAKHIDPILNGDVTIITDHSQLHNRDAREQHPQCAIQHLENDFREVRADIDDLYSGKADTAHSHVFADVADLQGTLDLKVNSADLAKYATASALASGLAGKADASHAQAISTVTGLQGALDAKANASALSSYATTATLNSAVAKYLPLTGGTLTGNLAIPATGNISFGSGVSPKLNLYGTTYQIGIESNTLYFRSANTHRFYIGTVDTAYINATDIYHGGVGLKAAINAKANASHTHTTAQVSGLDAALAAKAPLTSPTFSGNLSTTGEIRTTSANSYRHAVGNYGTFWRQDGGTLYLMLTNSGDQYGNWNGYRPFYVNLATGIPTLTSPALVGTPTTPTAAAGANNTQVANTAFVQAAVGSKITYGTAALTPGVSSLATGTLYARIV